MVELRDYQIAIVEKAVRLLQLLKIVYLAMEVRTGKTLTALKTAERYGAKKVLFVTMKKAIASIENDYNELNPSFSLEVINFEQLKNVKEIFDFFIVDEAHGLGAFPKPSERTKLLKSMVAYKPLILLSGTPTPETYSQIFHQFWISDNSPFRVYANFYKWAKDFVLIRQKKVNSGFPINDYSHANEVMIRKFTDPYFISYTQQEAGFESEVVESVHHIKMQPATYKLAEILLKDRYYKMKCGEEIVCDSAAKLKSKLHQLFSGTIKTESGIGKVLDLSKIDFIKQRYQGKKIAIFYKFIAEGMALRQAFPGWTDSPEVFNSSMFSTFICQIQSGSMGTNLSTADVIIFYNIDFSAKLYWQARARNQTKDKKDNAQVHWLFSEAGLEDKIYKRVIKKRDYTTSHFRRDFECVNNLFKQSA